MVLATREPVWASNPSEIWVLSSTAFVTNGSIPLSGGNNFILTKIIEDYLWAAFRWFRGIKTNAHTYRVPLCFVFAVNEGKGVDDAEEVTCFAGSNKGSNSEVQSLSSFQSDSGDDNGKK